MQFFITPEKTDLQGLSAMLFRRSNTASGALERIMALNPQIEDFQKLSAGTVLILPDGPEFKPGAGTAVSGEGFDAIAEDLSRGMKAVGSRADNRFEELRADHANVVAALKSTTSRRLIESDPALKEQLRAAEARFEADHKRAAEAQKQLMEVQTFALAEFEKLQKMLGQ